MIMTKADFVNMVNAHLAVYDRVMKEPLQGNMILSLNQAAFHAEWAIEACLKYVLDENGRLASGMEQTQDIGALLKKIGDFLPDFLTRHKFLVNNADALTKFDELEEGIKKVDEKTARKVCEYARTLFEEVKEEKWYLNIQK